MALSKGAVKTQIRTLLDTNLAQTNEEASRNAFADAMADIICNAVKDGVESALYDTGLVAPAGTAGGPVTGAVDLSLTITP